MKHREFKPGQLVTVNHIVYRCRKANVPCSCGKCDMIYDRYIFAITREQQQKICVRCQGYYKNFKRVNYA